MGSGFRRRTNPVKLLNPIASQLVMRTTLFGSLISVCQPESARGLIRVFEAGRVFLHDPASRPANWLLKA